MSDLWHVLVGRAVDGSEATVEVFREEGRFRWVLTTEGDADTRDTTEDFVPYISGDGFSDDDYEALLQALTSTLPGLGVPDFPDLFSEVPPAKYMMSQMPPEILEGIEIYTTSDLIAVFGDEPPLSDEDRGRSSTERRARD